jgi:uncharacterized RDD family membrane protein YckC
LRRRALARAIDVAILGLPMFVYIGRGIYTQRRRGDYTPSALEPPAPIKRALELFSFVVTVEAERGRTPGFRIMGLRTADARTGAEIGLSQAIVRVAVGKMPGLLLKPLTRRQRAEAQVQSRRLEALAPELSALKSKHADDIEALNEATLALYQERGVDPFASCGPMLKRLPLAIVLHAITRRLLNHLIAKPIVVDR